MMLGALTPDLVRSTYLRGIDLGALWSGPSADAAIAQLLLSQVAHLEALMNIHVQRWQVATFPDATAAAGTDYQDLGTPIPYVPLAPDEDTYRLTLAHHDVHAVTRVRLYLGPSQDPTPVPVFTTVPLTGMTFPMPDERLWIPQALVTLGGQERAWAVDYVIGLGMLPAELVEWCAIGAAIEVLSMAAVGADVSHGLASESLNQDGIEEKVQYGGSREAGGMYAGPIAMLRDRRADIDLRALRFRYQNTLGDRSQLPADAVLPQRTQGGLLAPVES